MGFADPGGVAEGFRAAWNRASAEELTAVFTTDADFVNVVGFWWRGHRQIRHNHAIGFRDMFPDTAMAFEKTRIRMLGEGHAVVHARWRVDGQRVPDASATSRAGTRRGVFTFVVSRFGEDGWLAVAAHNTDIIPGAQTHLTGDDGTLRPVRYQAQPD